MLLIAETLAGEEGSSAALPLTPMVELAHNASLIHDDIEDKSDERRGKPAIHLLYGNDAAINSGSFLYFLPLTCMGKSQLSDRAKIAIYETWGLFMKRLHLGQAMDIAWHNDFYSKPQIPEYERMCRLKTGCLAGMAAVLAVQCVQDCLNKNGIAMSGDLPQKLEEGAQKLGVGFQILDDVKNLETGVPGKKRGDDIVEGKKSLPVLLFLHRYPEKQDFIVSCFSAARKFGINAAELEELITALKTSGVLEEARERGAGMIQESRDFFSGINSFSGKAETLLYGLIDFISDI